MSAPADWVSAHRTPERATNRTQNVLKFGEIAPDFSLGEFLTFNSRHGAGCSDLPKLRACDLVRLRVRDICHGDRISTRAIVIQQMTSKPVQFEITPPTRDAVAE